MRVDILNRTDIIENMNMYSKAINWLRQAAETQQGGKAALMRQAAAVKATFYRTLNEEQGKPPSAETFMNWLDRLGFRLLTPNEKCDSLVEEKVREAIVLDVIKACYDVELGSRERDVIIAAALGKGDKVRPSPKNN